jgi:hypothetical protein
MGNLDFNQSDYQPRSEMGAVPAGKYRCRIEDTERKDTKPDPKNPNKPEAQYLQITHVITEGEYKGRKIFDRLNLWIAQGGQWVRRTDDAGTIAGQAMSELLAALGMATIRNHEELRNKALVVKVKVRKSDEYGDSNDVQNYYPATAETAPAGAPVTPPAPKTAPADQPAGQPSSAATGGVPWQKPAA